MTRLIQYITRICPTTASFHPVMLCFRVMVSGELMVVHGLKKIGIGVASPEVVPNPLQLPVVLNHQFAVAANLVFPVFVMLGFFTRLAVLPILAVTLTGYFALHWNGPLNEGDPAFMYSTVYLLLLVIGPGKYSVDFLIHDHRELSA